MLNAELIEQLLHHAENGLETLLKSRKQGRAHLRGIVNDLLDGGDRVTRDEFEALRAMLSKARMIQEDLNERMTKLELKLNRQQPAPKAGKKNLKKLTATKPSLRSVKHDKRGKRR